MTTTKPPCGCLRLRAEQSLTDAAAEELEAAHAIIRIMLNCIPDEAKRDMCYRIAVAGLGGEGATRANEREAMLKRLAVARAGRAATPMLYAQEQVAAASLLAAQSGRYLLAQDLAALGSAISDIADAAGAVLKLSASETPEHQRLRAVAARFGTQMSATAAAVPAEARQ